MSDTTQDQICPYCNHEVDESQAEWEEGDHDVTCEKCEKEYKVTTQYKFLGFEIHKYCNGCGETEDDCYCIDTDEI